MKGVCSATTKKGRPCRARPTANGFCLLHSTPTKAAELGRIGGKQNQKMASASAMPRLESAASACEVLDSIYSDVMNDVIKPPKANVLMKLMALKVELLDKKCLEEQIAKMERQIEELSLILARKNDFLASEDQPCVDENQNQDRED
jgi:hypothetical protein